MDLPVEVVQQASEPPGLHVLAEFLGVEAHAGLHRQHVPDQVFILDIFTDKGKGFVSGSCRTSDSECQPGKIGSGSPSTGRGW